WPRHNGKLLADAGIFLPGHDEDFLFLDLGDSGCWQALFHEYAHAILDANTSPNVQLWFEEGFGQYFSSLRVERGQADIGLPPLDALGFLRAHHELITVRDLFRVTRDMPIYNQPGE